MEQLVGNRKYADFNQPFAGECYKVWFDIRRFQFRTTGRDAFQHSVVKPNQRQDFPYCYVGGTYDYHIDPDDKTAGTTVYNHEQVREIVGDMNRRLMDIEHILADMDEYKVMRTLLMLFHGEYGLWLFAPHPLYEMTNSPKPGNTKPQPKRNRNKRTSKHQTAHDAINNVSSGKSTKIENPVGKTLQVKPKPVSSGHQHETTGIVAGLDNRVKPADTNVEITKELLQKFHAKDDADKKAKVVFHYLGIMGSDLAGEVGRQVKETYDVFISCVNVPGSEGFEQTIWFDKSQTIEPADRSKLYRMVKYRVRKYGEPLVQPTTNARPVDTLNPVQSTRRLFK